MGLRALPVGRVRRFKEVPIQPLWSVRTVSGRHSFILNAASWSHAIRKAARAMAGNKVRSKMISHVTWVEYSGYEFEVPKRLT